MAEALVALLIGLLVVHLALTSMFRLRAVQSRLTARGEFIGAMRLVRLVVRRELRVGVLGQDATFDGDSLSLRAFRGTAIVCARQSPTEFVVSFEGLRLPNESKDSVLTIGSLGRRGVAALVSSRAQPGPCAAGPSASAQIWELDRDLGPDLVVLRLFERGSYHVSTSALRYRSGGGGRQPLTPEIFDTPASRWTTSGSAHGVELLPLDSASGAPWRGFMGAAPPR